MFAVLSVVSSRGMLFCCSTVLLVSLLCISQAHALQGEGQPQFSVGDRVQFQRMGKTLTGKIIEMTGPGWPRVEYQEKDRTRRTVFPPKLLEAAAEVPEEEKPAEDPKEEMKTTSGDSTLREWKSSKGTFSVRAKLISQDDDSVKLETETGKVVEVPITKLSSTDRAFLTDLASGGENPFGEDGVAIDPAEAAQAAEATRQAH